MFLNRKNMAIKQYFKDTASEMRHVSWPTRKQAVLYTTLVIVISLVVASYLGALDALFAKLLNLFIA